MASTQEDNNKEQNVSPASLLSSAKVVAEAAQTALRHDPHSVDKAKAAADAAADLLDAGSHYTKLEQSAYGKYVDKAEDYLHQIKPAPSTGPPTATGAAEEDSKDHSDEKKPTATASAPEKKEGGTGDLLKMAQGFLK